MARFTLLMTAWKKHTKENWVIHMLEWSAERPETTRVRDALPLSHEVQNVPPCFLNSISEGNVRASGSRLSPRLDQCFVSKGLHMNVSLASIQHTIKVIKAKSKLSRYRVMHDVGRLPKICHWWKISLLWGATLNGVPVQGQITTIQPPCPAGRAQRRLT